MNEDEAFIRAIVDTPGDDTPRLVYADWLDERVDPRGPYLRAELEWVRTGKKVKVLRAIGATLDSVWVYRVSRPPVGVCLAKEIFSECDAVLTPEKVSGTAASYPAEYRAFLLNYNGGVLTDDAQETITQDDSEITGFASLSRPGQEERFIQEGVIPTIEQLKRELVHPNGSDRVLADCIPIAYVQGEFDAYNCLLLRPSSKQRSSLPSAVIYYSNPRGREWSDEDIEELGEDEDDDDDSDDDDRQDRLFNSMNIEDYVRKVAPNLPAFLARF